MFIINEARQALTLNLLLVSVARIFYLFLLKELIEKKEFKASIINDGGKKKEEKKIIKNKYVLFKRIIIELLIWIGGIAQLYLAVAIFSFSFTKIIIYSKIIRKKINEKDKKDKNDKKDKKIKIFGIFGQFFQIIGWVLLLLTFNGPSPAYIEIIFALLGVSLAIWFSCPFSKILENNFYNWYYKIRRWKKVKVVWKVSIISLLVFGPIFFLFGGYIYYYPKMQEYYIPMRDGTLLRTHVYFPSNWDGTPKGVILSRTPYNIKGLEGYAINYVAYQDFIFVAQDLRGTPSNGEGSQGLFRVFLDEWSDGVDTVNWILEQNWCNGKIATVGGSALAINQVMYHPEVNGKIGAASIVVGTGDLYDNIAFIGGAPRLHLIEEWAPSVAGPRVYQILNEFMEHPIKDDFYSHVSLTLNKRYRNISVRALHFGGWYDMFCQGTIDDFILYNQGSEYAREHQFLVMGPWSHYLQYKHLDIEYPEDQKHEGLSLLAELEGKLFSEYFYGEAINWENEPHVYYYVMGDPEGINSGIDYNIWKTAKNWPINYSIQPWYLYSNGTLDVNYDQTIYTKNYGKISYLFNPLSPVDNGGGTTLTLKYIGAVDQRRVEYTNSNSAYLSDGTTFNSSWVGIDRKDIVKFTSKTLQIPLEIVGQIKTQLYISSNCTDTDFTAKLIDIYPDGKEILIGDGILKARYRDGFNQSNLMVPGNIYEINIDLWSTAYYFAPGHKIRLSISSSNYPKFTINPNTGEAVNWTHVEQLENGTVNYFIANNTIYCGENGYYSRILFPIPNA